MAVRLLIVDDHAQLGAFMCRLLDGAEFDVVGVSAAGASGLESAQALAPEIVLLDVQLPDINGFEVAERLANGSCPPQVVMTSTRDADDFGARLERAPVIGFLAKQDVSVPALVALLSAGDSR